MKHFTEYKKPILICIGFLFFMGMIKAQDLSRAKLLLQQKDYARAKETVDSLLLINGANAATWLLKADIYNAINKDAAARNLVVDAGQEAFLALQKATQLNAAEVNTQLKGRGFDLPFDLYNNFTNAGLTFFNAGVERNDKPSYQQALNNFKQAGLVSRYIYTNGWGLAAIDTLNLYYTAKAAINADKEEDAIINCKKIADENITETATQKDFETIYQWLVYYYKTKQDEQNFYKYAEAGTRAFPNSSYFTLSYIDWYRQRKDYTSLLAQYKILFAKDDANFKYELHYFNDIFSYLYQNKLTIDNRAAYESQLSKGLLQYIKLNPVNADARLLLAKLYTNQASDVFKQSLLRSTTDAKVMNAYKTAQRNLLLKSNVQLKQIVNKRAAVSKAIYEEAKGLLVLNNVMLK
jgi:hypothetical protein